MKMISQWKKSIISSPFGCSIVFVHREPPDVFKQPPQKVSFNISCIKIMFSQMFTRHWIFKSVFIIMIHYPCLPVPLASPNPEQFASDWFCVEAQVTVKAVQSVCEISNSSLLISCLPVLALSLSLALSLIRSIICIYLSLVLIVPSKISPW